MTPCMTERDLYSEIDTLFRSANMDLNLQFPQNINLTFINLNLCNNKLNGFKQGDDL